MVIIKPHQQKGDFKIVNIFKSARQRYIPTSANNCLNEDSVSSNLWAWAGRIETIGKIFFFLIIGFGIYSSIQSANQEVLINYYPYTKKDFNVELFIGNILRYVWYAVIELVSFHTGALLVGTAANISHNTRIISNFAIFDHFNTEQSNTEQSDEKTSNIIKTPAHGLAKDDGKKQDENLSFSFNVPGMISSRGIMYCPKCHAENPIGSKRCFRCDTEFRHDDQLKTGDIIIHPEFGEGEVISEDTNSLKVRFDNGLVSDLGRQYALSVCKKKNNVGGD